MKRLLEFLGSMYLAITLLVLVAVASVAGTVVQQNQPWNDYVIKFGPFWFEVFKSLGLYDVYHALWFIAVLAFLVVSVSVCLYRQTPAMLRQMRDWRDRQQLRSMKRHRLARTIELDGGANPALAGDLGRFVSSRGYRVRVFEKPGGASMIAARRGGANRLGYLFTHAAVVIIAVGGLIDGNVPLLIAEWQGRVTVETRDLPASQMPSSSVLPASGGSFRGRVTIPEGSRADVAFINIRDGFLVQKLPFSIEVEDFRVEQYDNGQPKSFESDLVIHDPGIDEPVRGTIAVNHPLTHRGVTIYQASFSDGGSRLEMKVWPMDGGSLETSTLESRVNAVVTLGAGEEKLDLEFDDFRKFNVFNRAEDPGEVEFQNVGSSFQYKLRRADGRASEFQNYMSPVLIEGRPLILAGYRQALDEEFRFLHLPVTRDGSLERLFAVIGRLRDRESRDGAADLVARSTAAIQPDMAEADRQRLFDNTRLLFDRFASEGFAGVEQWVLDTAGEADRENLLRAYFNVIRLGIQSMYEAVLEAEGQDLAGGISEFDAVYFADLMAALGAIADYPSPFYLQLTGFEHREATGLELTRAPGKNIVYLGCALLMAGVFMLFYISQKRLWIWLGEGSGRRELVIAGADQRQSPEFDGEFATMAQTIETELARADLVANEPTR